MVYVTVAFWWTFIDDIRLRDTSMLCGNNTFWYLHVLLFSASLTILQN